MDCAFFPRLLFLAQRALQDRTPNKERAFCEEFALRRKDLAACMRGASPEQRGTILDAARLCGHERDELERSIEEEIERLPPAEPEPQPEPSPVRRRDDPVR